MQFKILLPTRTYLPFNNETGKQMQPLNIQMSVDALVVTHEVQWSGAHLHSEVRAVA
jgi:hypothetical protein